MNFFKDKFKSENIIQTMKSKADAAISAASNAIESHKKGELAASIAASLEIEPTAKICNISFITPRIMIMPLPADVKQQKRCSTFLRLHYGKGNYMVYNLSEKTYDYSKFDPGSIIEHKFPGLPSPPLALLFNMCTSIESYLNADKDHVVIIHCYTGKGRSIITTACYLAWIGKVENPSEGLQYVCDAMGIALEDATIPSQRRWADYFENMLESKKPRPHPSILKRVIVNSIPTMDKSIEGCRPQLQLFKNGKLIYNSMWSSLGQDVPNIVKASEGSMLFPVNMPVYGDILLRCRHYNVSSPSRNNNNNNNDNNNHSTATTKQVVSMFRTAFHTGYITDNILRFSKNQLDGACNDDRFASEAFFLELIFGDVEEFSETLDSEGVVLLESDKPMYESMLKNESSLWKEIEKKKKTRHRKPHVTLESLKTNIFSIDCDNDNATDAIDTITTSDGDVTIPSLTNETSVTDEIDNIILEASYNDNNNNVSNVIFSDVNEENGVTGDIVDKVLDEFAELEIELGLVSAGLATTTLGNTNNNNNNNSCTDNDINMSVAGDNNNNINSNYTNDDVLDGSDAVKDKEFEELESYFSSLEELTKSNKY